MAYTLRGWQPGTCNTHGHRHAAAGPSQVLQPLPVHLNALNSSASSKEQCKVGGMTAALFSSRSSSACMRQVQCSAVSSVPPAVQQGGGGAIDLYELLPATVPLPGGQIRLTRPAQPRARGPLKLLVFLPGTDGTGRAVLPQLNSLSEAGFTVYCQCVPPPDRSNWQELTTGTVALLERLLSSLPPNSGITQVTLLGESFGGALALRVAAAAPQLLHHVVLLNPATCFDQSLGGVSSLVSATNLLSFFPPALYRVAQATLLPLLVAPERLTAEGVTMMKAMIEMRPTECSREGPRLKTPGINGTQSSVDDAAESGYGAPPPAGAMDLPFTLPFTLPPTLSPSPTASAANFRASLLREGGIPDGLLTGIQTPVLLISSAKDRLLPSLQEGARLQRLLPRAQRVVLPDSGHAAMLEEGWNIGALIRTAQLPGASTAPASGPGTLPARTVGGNGGAGSKPHNAYGTGSGNGAGAAETNGTPAGARSATNGTTQPHGANGTGAAVYAGTPASGSASAATNGTHNGNGSSNGTGKAGGDGKGLEGSSGARVDATATPPPPPDVDSFDEWAQILAPWRDLVSPVLVGFEHLPAPGSPNFTRPMLFVGNHQRVGWYDTPLLVYELAIRGYRVRGLAHPGHWSGPVGPFFEKFGSVKASPMAAFRLLRNNEKVLLFPGGAKEVCKPKGADYQLAWKDEPDFVRLATKMGALIVPFAAVGADDAYEVLMDTGEVINHPVLGPMAAGVLRSIDPALQPHESVLPITRLPGLGIPSPIPIPNLQRLYFKFSDPIDTALLKVDLKDGDAMAQLYGDVRATVEQSIQELLELRRQDSGAQVWGRLTRAAGRWTELMADTALPPGMSAADYVNTEAPASDAPAAAHNDGVKATE